MAAAVIVTERLSKLHHDPEVYDRNSIDWVHVERLAQAIRAGDELPPIIVDKQSRVIVDGVHRYYAALRVHGEDGEIAVEYRRFRSRGEMIAYAARVNSRHGLRLLPSDYTRIVHMLRCHGYSDSSIADVLGVTQDDVTRYALRAVQVETPTAMEPAVPVRVIPGTSLAPVHGSTKHLAGSQCSPEQAAVIDRTVGPDFGLVARQLREAIAAGLIPPDREDVVIGLAQLAEAIVRYLTSRKRELSKETRDTLTAILGRIARITR